MMRNTVLIGAAAVVAGVIHANASVVISTAATQNMACSAGLCKPTADHAVLNVGDLETLLASGDVTVSTSNHSVKAEDIVIEGAFSSSSSYTLSLQAHHRLAVRKRTSMQGAGSLVLFASHLTVAAPVSISGSASLDMEGKTVRLEAPVSISGPGTLQIQSYRGTLDIDSPVSIQGSGAVDLYGNVLYGHKGSIAFANLSATLTIGSTPYTLENSLPDLAAAIAANPHGNFALANPYDASGDGTYPASPIMTNFLGSFDGLGNAISNISVNNPGACCVAGLFQDISEGAGINHVSLTNISVTSVGGAAGLVYESFGGIAGSHVSGNIDGGSTGDIGGLVADNYGDIENSYAAVAASAGATVSGIEIGGLVGVDYGYVEASFATGAVSAGNGSGSIGGLVGEETDDYGSSYGYALGNVSGGSGLSVGGLIGTSDYSSGYGSVQQSYSTGAVSGGDGGAVGGLIGSNSSNTGYDYWDTTTSGTSVGVGLGNAAGVTGLTTTQLQSGLPYGFSTQIWSEKAKVNNGLPYLIDNPPQK